MRSSRAKIARSSTTSRSRSTRSSAPSGSSSISSRGRGRERAGERHALLLAARELARPAGRPKPAQPDERRAARRRAPARRPPATPCMRSPNATLPATSRWGNSAWSWNISPNRRRCGGVAGRSTPSQRHRARVERLEPGDRPQQRALAAAARPEHAHDLTVARPAGRRRRARNVVVVPDHEVARRVEHQNSPDRSPTRHARDRRRASPPRSAPSGSTLAAIAAPKFSVAGLAEQPVDRRSAASGCRAAR